MLPQPEKKYRAVTPVDLPDRQWPTRVITRPPIWMSTDLRDGNQSLFEPMSVERKLRFFKTLVQIGLKEIEVAFPSASQTDFDFVRLLIEEGHIPDDVTIEVLTQAREHLIRRTMESLRGAKRAIVHVYNATAPAWREIVFGLSQTEVRELAVSSARLIRELADQQPETAWTFQYSPETFTATELPFAKSVCDAVVDAFGGTPRQRVIINLPATVEVATPNHYADQVEWMHRHLARRDSIILSLHPHNDRGTAVAAAELGLLAGADRVEGCLFGNGERTGNVDLVTLALNLYTQGIHPGLDFSDINAVARTVEHCNQLPIHPRHPYVGDLVFTAFSGSHQDAIKKGFAARPEREFWDVPYLPIDPQDVGRSYASIIRVNSQSGKGGIAYLLENAYGVILPRRLLIEFSHHVQQATDASGSELLPADIWACFQQHYVNQSGHWHYRGHSLPREGLSQGISLTLHAGGEEKTHHGIGPGPLAAAVDALATGAEVVHFEERALGQGASAEALALIELRLADGRTVFGAGIHGDIVTASLLALVSALNRGRKSATGSPGQSVTGT